MLVLPQVLQLNCHIIIGYLERHPEVLVNFPVGHGSVFEVDQQLQAVADDLVGLPMLTLVAQTRADVEHGVHFLVDGHLELVFEQKHELKVLLGHLVIVQFLVEAPEVVEGNLDELALGLGVQLLALFR